jgi:hypothetical protein
MTPLTSAHEWSAVSLTPPTTGHWCHRNLPPPVSGVIDTADHKKSELTDGYLDGFEPKYETALTCGSGAQTELFDE